MSSDLSLALSLVFGVAQIVIGGGVAVELVRRGRWRSGRGYLLLLIALWFPCSGIGELIVSGMEVARRLTAIPSAATLILWRARVDASLLVVAGVLLAGLGVFPLVRRLASRDTQTEIRGRQR